MFSKNDDYWSYEAFAITFVLHRFLIYFDF